MRHNKAVETDAQGRPPRTALFFPRAPLTSTLGLTMITLEMLESMFADMRVKTTWPIDGPMLWGYFFTDSSDDKLRAVVPLLEAEGYTFVDLFIPELDEDQEPYFFLHVEREEAHTAQSLHERNQHFYAFAEAHGLATYDGMDVGPISRSGEVQ
jgi:hypothetical protein